MRLSLQTLRVLQIFMEDPSEPRYGLELMDRTALKSGTIYPALHRLESEGWLRSWSEPVDSADVGRPARRLYALTPTGLASAENAVEPFRTAPRADPGRLHPKARLA
jgi:PadR family transcriptional regulator, regulatory protein PadR